MEPPEHRQNPTTTSRRRAADWAPATAILLGSILYSGKGLFGKHVLAHGITVPDLMALRTIWAAPAYLVVLLVSLRRQIPSKGDVARLFAWGVMGFWLAPRLTFQGLVHTSAGLERILIQTSPAWIVLLVWFLRDRKPGVRTLSALGLCYAGLLLACFGRDGSRAVADPVGVGFILAGCFLWSVFVVHIGPLQKRCGVGVTTSSGMLVGALCSGVESALRGRFDVVMAPGVAVVAPMLGLVVFSTVIPSFLTQGGLARLGPVRTGILSLAGPALVPLAAAAFLGERMSWPQMTGLAVVVVASVPLSLGKDG